MSWICKPLLGLLVAWIACWQTVDAALPENVRYRTEQELALTGKQVVLCFAIDNQKRINLTLTIEGAVTLGKAETTMIFEPYLFGVTRHGVIVLRGYEVSAEVGFRGWINRYFGWEKMTPPTWISVPITAIDKIAMHEYKSFTPRPSYQFEATDDVPIIFCKMEL